MDYLTYTLKIEGISHPEADAVAAFLVASGDAGPGDDHPPYPFDQDYEYADGRAWFGDGGESKGYPRDAVREISIHYPDALFIMEGRGHEEDCFRSYVKDGRVQEAGREIRYEPFDPTKLTPCVAHVGDPSGDPAGKRG